MGSSDFIIFAVKLWDTDEAVDGPDQHILAGKKSQELDRHARIAAFERDLVD